MKVLVLGATGGSGRAAVDALLEAGHEVTAFSRNEVTLARERLSTFVGDALNPAQVERAVRGHDAVVVALGIRENPLKVRWSGPRATSLHVRSEGTRWVIEAMKKHGVRRLVVQSSYGVGPSRSRLSFKWKVLFSLLLKPQIADTEVQEELVRESGLDWVLVQPVGLDDKTPGEAFASPTGETRSMSVSRRAVGRVVASLVDGSRAGQTLALST